jgi:hypothetical protein
MGETSCVAKQQYGLSYKLRRTKRARSAGYEVRTVEAEQIYLTGIFYGTSKPRTYF